MKTKTFDALAVAAGLLLTGLGLILLRLPGDPQGLLLTLPYVCVGLGCGSFGHGMGDIINRRALRRDPARRRRQQIESQDERNQAIANRAKAKAYDMMVFVFGALLVSFALMGVDLAPVLLLVFAYLLVVGCHVYYLVKLEKEM